MEQFNRYRALVCHLADVALHAAEAARDADAGANLPPIAGQASLALALPAARLLLTPDAAHHAHLLTAAEAMAQLAPAPDAHAVRMVTLLGQSRSVYHPLALHLFLRALRRQGSTIEPAQRKQIEAALREAAAVMTVCHARTPRDRERFALVLWQAVCLIEAAAALPARDANEQDIARIRATVDALLTDFAGEGPLHPHDPNDQLDAWTYRELVGAHALAHLARLTGEVRWRARVAAAARYHLECTQPDYTTYEPWGVPAFAEAADTLIFVDQQLHDVSTNVQLSGDASALVPGLLLADAADVMGWGMSDV